MAKPRMETRAYAHACHQLPLPGDQQRQERDYHNEEKHQDNASYGKGPGCIVHVLLNSLKSRDYRKSITQNRK